MNGVHLYNPPVFCVTQAGPGPMKLLKRMFSVTLNTSIKTVESMGNRFAFEEVYWKPTDEISSLFIRSKKFYIDFLQEEMGGAYQVAASIAKKFGGQFNGVASRSFGASGGCKRKLFTIIFPPDFEVDAENVWKPYIGEILGQLDICIAFGWEDMFNCERGSYILKFDNALPFHDMSFLSQISESVLVARNKAIIVLADHVKDVASFGAWLSNYNENCSKWSTPFKFSVLYSSDGRIL